MLNIKCFGFTLSTQWLFIRGDFTLLGHRAFQDIFVVTTQGCFWYLLGRGQRHCQTSTIAKNYQAPNVKSTVEKPYRS